LLNSCVVAALAFVIDPLFALRNSERHTMRPFIQPKDQPRATPTQPTQLVQSSKCSPALWLKGE